MTGAHFVSRDACPGCRTKGRTTLYTGALLDEPLRGHLVRQYEAVGSIELEYLEGARYALEACASCGLVYQSEVPGDALMERIYDRWIDAGRALASHRANRDHAARLRFVREVLMAERRLRTGDDPVRALDVGMGWGAWCQVARAFGCDAVGLENSPARIAHARSQGIPVIRWEDLAGQRFAFIHSEQVFEHLTAPLDALERLREALAPGGLLKLSVPDGRDIRRRLARADWSAGEGHPDSLLSVTPLQHINCFDRRALLAMAGRAGLRLAPLTFADWVATNADFATPSHSLAALTRPLGRRFAPSDTYVWLERDG